MEYVTLDSGQRETWGTGARRDVRTGKGRFDLLPVAALKRWAQLLERGALKYGDRNWERGIPLSRFADSAFRHLTQLLAGDTEEDHAAAVLFNVGAIIHHREAIARGTMPAELDDLPRQTTIEHEYELGGSE